MIGVYPLSRSFILLTQQSNMVNFMELILIEGVVRSVRSVALIIRILSVVLFLVGAGR